MRMAIIIVIVFFALSALKRKHTKSEWPSEIMNVLMEMEEKAEERELKPIKLEAEIEGRKGVWRKESMKNTCNI